MSRFNRGVRVVSFNIQHGRTAAGDVDVVRTGAVCASFEADVLGLQEVDRGVVRSGRTDQAAELAAATGLQPAFGEAIRLNRGSYGNALLVRGDLFDVDVVPLPARDRREARSVLLARARLDGHDLSLGVTHLSTDVRLAPRQLLAALDELWRLPSPRLLLGDFNLHHHDVARLLEAVHLSVSGPVGTFPAWQPNRTIDFVVASGLEVVETRAVHADVSDHRALVTEVVPS